MHTASDSEYLPILISYNIMKNELNLSRGQVDAKDLSSSSESHNEESSEDFQVNRSNSNTLSIPRSGSAPMDNPAFLKLGNRRRR